MLGASTRSTMTRPGTTAMCPGAGPAAASADARGLVPGVGRRVRPMAQLPPALASVLRRIAEADAAGGGDVRFTPFFVDEADGPIKVVPSVEDHEELRAGRMFALQELGFLELEPHAASSDEYGPFRLTAAGREMADAVSTVVAEAPVSPLDTSGGSQAYQKSVAEGTAVTSEAATVAPIGERQVGPPGEQLRDRLGEGDTARSVVDESPVSRLPSFSKTSRLALTYAAAMLEDREAQPVQLHAAALLGALRASAHTGMTPTTGEVVRLVLSRQVEGRAAEPVFDTAAAAAGLSTLGDARPTARSIQELARSPVRPLVVQAAGMADRTGTAGVHLRHILATGADPDVPAGVLAELGITLAELRSLWRESIARTWPDDSQDGWDAILRDPPADARDLELVGGISADMVDPTKRIELDEDHLGVSSYVVMLALAIADEKTPVPLSIGLFGEWGSGKSTFMGLLRGQIDEIARSGRLGYLESIHQVGFNAWHYADTNLWASLGQEIFEQLAGPENPVEEQREALRSALTKNLQTRKDLEAARGRAEEEAARLREELDNASVARAASARALISAAARSDVVKDELNEAWSRLGVRDEAEQAQRLADELRATSGAYDELRKSVPPLRARTVAVTVALLLVAAICAFALENWLAGGSLAAIGALLGTALTAVARFRSGLAKLRDAALTIKQGVENATLEALRPDLDALRRVEASQELLEAQSGGRRRPRRRARPRACRVDARQAPVLLCHQAGAGG